MEFILTPARKRFVFFLFAEVVPNSEEVLMGEGFPPGNKLDQFVHIFLLYIVKLVDCAGVGAEVDQPSIFRVVGVLAGGGLQFWGVVIKLGFGQGASH